MTGAHCGRPIYSGLRFSFGLKVAPNFRAGACPGSVTAVFGHCGSGTPPELQPPCWLSAPCPLCLCYILITSPSGRATPWSSCLKGSDLPRGTAVWSRGPARLCDLGLCFRSENWALQGPASEGCLWLELCDSHWSLGCLAVVGVIEVLAALVPTHIWT